MDEEMDRQQRNLTITIWMAAVLFAVSVADLVLLALIAGKIGAL